MKLKEALKDKLTKKELGLVPSSYDIVGSILIFSDFPLALAKKEKMIAQVLLGLHNNISTVCKKTKQYSGVFRTPKLKILAGTRTKETLHKENNISLLLDVEKVYFSPRSANERKRIFSMVKDDEKVLVMFSGCAPYVISIAKNSNAKSVYGVEINPVAHKYALINSKKNKVDDRVFLYLGDVRKVVPKLNKKFDRILMPLPRDAEMFLDVALSSAKKGCTIHINQFLNEKDFAMGKKKIKQILKELNTKNRILRMVKCGQYAPGTFRVCFDIRVA